MSAPAVAEGLSGYRGIQLGTDLPIVAEQVGVSPSRAKVVHRRPALVQELQWWPQPLGPSSGTEQAKEVVFSFYNGELFRIAIDYDRYETEGLTTDDLIEAISATYGAADEPASPVGVMLGRYGDRQEIVARWRDSQHCFELIRSDYGPSFRLVGALKRLQAPAGAAIAEAKRLDVLEAPERDAARIAAQKEAERAKLEQSRRVNKPKFRP
jgi:hypothetical protein